MGTQEICGLINSSTFVTLPQKIRRGLKKAGELDIPKVFNADDLGNLPKTGEVQKQRIGMAKMSARVQT